MTEFANLADPIFRLQMMRDTIIALRDTNTLWYPLLNVITALIDGLASAPRGKTKIAFQEYIKAHLPNLHSNVGAKLFYEHFRNPAIHEYGLHTGYAIGRDIGMNGCYISEQRIPEIRGTLKVLNIDMPVEEFLAHLDSKIAQARLSHE